MLSKLTKRRGSQIPLGDGILKLITRYSMRQRIVTGYTNIMRHDDDARSLMGHSPGSKTLEHFYVDDAANTDVAAIAL
ncbi:hypothetical protein V495_08242 [Pseudogymnoascus sp. VKM F-4514 (FW-929)]|nr:hypothetical protein V495_08242 [Pseudogymnoascus sp. VKM F-4514 (FW-929)]